MSVGMSEYQTKIETEEEDDKSEMLRSEMLGLTRQVAKRGQFTLLEKMRTVRNIQRNIKVGHLSTSSAC